MNFTKDQIFFTADLHLGHKNIIKYCPKSRAKFRQVEEMNETIISNWNNTITDNDVVFVIGDFAWNNSTAINSLERMKGTKVLITGNHDNRLNNEALSHFEVVKDYIEFTTDDQYIVMFHYPLYTWNRGHYGSWCLHGHSHGNTEKFTKNKIIDVGVDTNNLTPYSYFDIERILNDTI